MIVMAHSLASMCVGADRVSGDGPPTKWRSQTMLSTSVESLHVNKNGRTTPGDRGGDGRVSGTRRIPARPLLVCARSVPELQAGDVCPEITNSTSTGREHGQAAPRMIVTARSLAKRVSRFSG